LQNDEHRPGRGCPFQPVSSGGRGDKEAFEKFARYDYRAIPISDEDFTMLGCVTYRDIVGLKHRFVD